jgi:hypothetical protein
VLEFAMFPALDHVGKTLADVGGRVPRLVEQSGICASVAMSSAGTNARKIWSLMDPELEPQALDISEKLIADFYFVHTEGMVHVCQVHLPAATVSLAIGKYIS